MVFFWIIVIILVAIAAILGRNMYLNFTAGPYVVTNDEIAAYYANALEESNDSIKKGVQQIMLGKVAKNRRC